MVPRWSQASPVGFFAAADLRRGGCTPHSFSSWRKRMRRARWKKKPLGPNLPVRASLGMRRLIANFPQSCHVLSECAATRLSTHAYAASCDVAFHSRVLVKAPCFSSRCRSRGWIPKEGAAAPSFWSFRKGVQGETQPKGFPLASLWGRPVSLGERNGSHLPSHHHGCPPS